MTPDRKQVLIADDEPNLRRVLAAQLVRDGYDVEAVASGTEAVRALRENHVDVVITDLRMPGIDGLDTLRALRELDPRLPVIVVTGYTSHDTERRCREAGAFECLHKPVDLDDLLRIVGEAVQAR